MKRQKLARQKCADMSAPLKERKRKRALLQKHARQNDARLIGRRKKNGRYIGLKQDSAGQLGLLYLITHLRHINVLLCEYWIS